MACRLLTSAPDRNPHHAKMMVISPNLYAQAPRQHRYCRVEKRNSLVRQDLEYIGGLPIVFRRRVDEAGPLHRFIDPARFSLLAQTIEYQGVGLKKTWISDYYLPPF